MTPEIPRPRTRLVLAVALGLLILLSACTGGNGTEAAAPSPTPRTEPARTAAAPSVEPRPGTAEVVADQLETGLMADPASVVSADSEYTAQQAREGFPAGTQVEVHEDSWSEVGAGRSGVVVLTATQSSGLEGTFAAVVQLEGEEWKILSTFALEEQP